LIYFLVNNNYHLIDVYNHSEGLKDYEKSLIQIPHTLECVNENKHFKNIYTFETPFKGLKNYFNIFKVKKKERDILKQLNINENDILFVYTEYEILNQYIMKLFKDVVAKVYVIEDGGFPTYLTYGVKNEGKLSFKEKIQLFYLKYIIGYKFVKFLKYNNVVFPQINEKYIDGVLLYLDVNIIRNVKKFLISKSQKKLNLDENKAVFLNEKMYDYYCSKEDYVTILDDCISKMTQKFAKVYFKFHPRETYDNKKWQLEVLNRYPTVKIIEENTAIEYLLEKYDTKYIFSFLSAALLNVNSMNAVPVYIYHFYNIFSEKNIFKQIDLILKNADYKFIDEFYNVDKIGFNKMLNNIDCIFLKNFINKEVHAFRNS